jgi:MoxR-like ATPase
MMAVRAKALIEGRFAPSVTDVAVLAKAALKHRMALTFAAKAEGGSIDEVIDMLIARTLDQPAAAA